MSRARAPPAVPPGPALYAGLDTRYHRPGQQPGRATASPGPMKRDVGSRSSFEHLIRVLQQRRRRRLDIDHQTNTSQARDEFSKQHDPFP